MLSRRGGNEGGGGGGDDDVTRVTSLCVDRLVAHDSRRRLAFNVLSHLKSTPAHASFTNPKTHLTARTRVAMFPDGASLSGWMAALVVACAALALNLCVLAHVRRKHGVALAGWRRVLLVISHPDDETMFFGPTLQALRSVGARTHVLCLSNGDADGLGAVREKELETAAGFLGVEFVEVVNDLKMRDGFNEKWPEDVVAARVETAVRRAKADVVLTFDSGGVSGHPNHVAAHRGVVRWRKTHTETEVKSKNPKAWALVTVHPARKFTMFADVFASWACETHVLAAATCPADLRRAMQMHRTQWVWYRKLFVVFSRYAYVNSLRRL